VTELAIHRSTIGDPLRWPVRGRPFPQAWILWKAYRNAGSYP